MKILVLGAGNMGAWFVESLCLEHNVGVFDIDKKKLRYFFHTHRFVNFEEIRDFNPDLLINAVSLQYTEEAFKEVTPYLSKHCILSDITSVKNGLDKYYQKIGMRFVSTHPMFGPTFANVRELSNQNAVIIKESDEEGKAFFRDFYGSFGLKIFEYTFQEHDKTTAYSLAIPFSSTMVFAATMKKQEAPGTTFKKHLEIARGLLSEDDYLLTEILFNPYALEQIENIHSRLDYLIKLIKERNAEGLINFFNEMRENIGGMEHH
ncbi:MAG: prephenate dehydrogenase/arogenate dehydrogenase family protein [Bacteroidota bacterium]